MPDDKKKIAIVGILFLVVIAVGAFQFTTGASAPAPATKKLAALAKPDAPVVPPVPNLAVSGNLPERDPFQSVVLEGEDVKATPISSPTPQTHPVPEPPRMGGRIRTNRLGDVPVLPNPTGPGGISGSGQEVRPVVPPEVPFTYSLAGILVGTRPAAVFRDAQGGQRLVQQGGALDGDTQVISIDREIVSVRFRGKTLRLTIGGNPSAK